MRSILKKLSHWGTLIALSSITVPYPAQIVAEAYVSAFSDALIKQHVHGIHPDSSATAIQLSSDMPREKTYCVVLIRSVLIPVWRLQIASWWDYGYQTTAMANRTVIVDNNTWNNTHIATVGRAMASPEHQAWQIYRNLDVKYVLVVFGGFVG